MSTCTKPAQQSVAGILSLVLALLGLAFFWLVPLGSISAGVGVLAGLVGVVSNYATAGRGLRQALVGLLLSSVALGLSLWLPLMLRGVLPEVF